MMKYLKKKKKTLSFRKKINSLFEKKRKTSSESDENFKHEQNSQYYGVFVIFELIKSFLKRRNYTKVVVFSSLYSLFRISLMFYFRYREKTTIIGENLGDIISITLISYNLFCFCFIIVSYCVSLIFSLNLKSYLMKQCSFLISPKRTLEYREIKLLPTMNIYCPFNLKAWCYIRKICLDYGQKFSYRIEAFLTLSILTVLIFIIILILELFNKIELENSIKIVILSDTICIIIILTLALIGGAHINDHFRFNFF